MEQKQVVESCEQAPLQDVDPLRTRMEAFLRKWFEGCLPPCLFRTLLQFLHKTAPWVHTGVPAENLGPQDSPSPDRLFWHIKKRLGTLICYTLAFVPSQFQSVGGYLLVDTAVGNLIPAGIKKMLIELPCQGCKRNQADLAQGEKPRCMEAIQGALPEGEDPEGSTYEPAKPECESDEHKSQNGTETDLETGEKNGVMMPKEQLNQQDELRDCPEAQELEGKEQEFRSSGDGSEHPGKNAISSSGPGQTLGDQAAGMASPKQEVTESHSAYEGTDTSLSSDSQEQWVDLSE